MKIFLEEENVSFVCKKLKNFNNVNKSTMDYEYYLTSTVEKTQLNAEILKKNMEIDSLKVYHY